MKPAHTDGLEDLHDDDLNAALAAFLPAPEHRWIETHGGDDYCDHCGREKWQDEKPCEINYSYRPSTVLKLLDRCYTWCSSRDAFLHSNRGYTVTLYLRETDHGWFVGWGPDFTRAAVVALVRGLRAGGKLEVVT